MRRSVRENKLVWCRLSTSERSDRIFPLPATVSVAHLRLAACHPPVAPLAVETPSGAPSALVHMDAEAFLVLPVAVCPEESHTLCLACGVNLNIKHGS